VVGRDRLQSLTAPGKEGELSEDPSEEENWTGIPDRKALDSKRNPTGIKEGPRGKWGGKRGEGELIEAFRADGGQKSLDED